MKYLKFCLMSLFMVMVLSGVVLAVDGDIYNDGYNRVNSSGTVIHNQDITETTGVTVSYKYDLYTNSACTAATEFELPAAEAGTQITFLLVKPLDVTIDPASSAQIISVTDTAGDSYSSDAATGSTVTLRALSATQWAVVASSGTWSDTN